MKVGLSTASFYPDAVTEEAIGLISQMGIDVAEVFLESYSEYNQDFCLKLKQLLDMHGIEVYSVHVLSTQYEPQLFSATERQRRDSMEIFSNVLKGARILGAEAYVFHGPPVRRYTTPHINFPRTGRIVDELAEYAAEFGIKFTWENVFWCWYSYPEFAPRLLEYARSQNLFFTIDIKQAMKSGEDPFKYLRLIGDRLANVHICDYNAEGELLLPGRGIFDFPRLVSELTVLGYNGPIILELYRDNYQNYGEIKASIDYLKGLLNT